MSSTFNWSSPTTLSSVSLNSSDQQIAIDGNGNVAAGWIENGFVKSSVKLVSGNWSTPALVSTNIGASSLRLVSDLNGNLTAVWLLNGLVKASSRPFGGSWSAAVALSTATATDPDIAVDQAGNVVVAWVRSGGVESSTKLFGQSWQNKVAITSTNAASTRVAIGGSGSNIRAVIAWYSTSTNLVYISTKLISGSWSTSLQISNITDTSAYPNVAVDSNGNAIAIWYSYNLVGTVYYNVVVQTASRLANATWSNPRIISETGIVNPANLHSSVMFDAAGDALAIWNTSFDGNSYTVQSASLPLRGAWTAPIDVINSLYSFKASARVASSGHALISFMFFNGSVLLIQVSEINVSNNNIISNWTVPVNVSNGTNNGFPQTALTLTGNTLNVAVIWVNNNGIQNLIQAVTGSKSLVLPPTSLSVTQNVTNYGIFSDYHNTLQWTASSSPIIDGYLVFRNGNFLEQVGSVTSQIVDNNQIQNGAVTYGLATVDIQGIQSNIVSVNYP